MSEMPMERKKSQLLFNFLPQDTFNHSSNGVIGRVQKLYQDSDEDVSNLPIQLIHQRIAPYLDQWDGHNHVQPSDIQLVPPGGAYFDIFPRVFECHSCSACTKISEDQMEKGYQPTCGSCGRNLTDTEQLPFVLVCKCGELDSVPLPTCPCGGSNPRLDRKTSRLEDARWYCTDCGNQLTDTAYEHIENCRYCGQGKRIKVHSSSSTFYPQSEKFVNVAKEDYEAAANAPGFQREIIVNYLLDEGGITTSSESAERRNELTDAIKNLNLNPDDVEEQLGVDMDDIKQLEKEASERQADQREEMREHVEDVFKADARQRISVELFEYRSILGDEGSSATAESLISLLNSSSRRSDLTAEMRQTYEEKRENINLNNIHLIEGFPITTVVYGYSRLENRPVNGVQLNTFRNQSAGATFFVQTAETEALLFSLNPTKVVSWLEQFEFFDSDTIEVNYDEWFLRNLRGYSRRNPLTDEEVTTTPVQELTLTLLHSFSHAILTAMDALSGYSQGSLVEYLLPHTLSFVVYKRSQTDFNIGAMHTFVESRFEELHQHLREDSDICIYDPVCETEENGSCEGCLFTSNMACSVRNLNLSRSVLHGGTFHEYDIGTGYLDV